MNVPKLKKFMGYAIYRSQNLSESKKSILLKYLQKEDNEARLLSVLLDGTIKKVTSKEEKSLRERFEKSGYKRIVELSDEGYEALGMATIAGGAFLGAKLINMLRNKMNICWRSCFKIKDTKSKKTCRIKCKIAALEEQLEHLRKVDCSRSINPTKCHEKAGVLAGKIRQKIEGLKNQLANLK